MSLKNFSAKEKSRNKINLISLLPPLKVSEKMEGQSNFYQSD